MESLVADLMELIHHRPLSKRLATGVRVLTPRGYGIVVDAWNIDRIDRFTELPARVLVELDGDGVRAPFAPSDVQVVEQVG